MVEQNLSEYFAAPSVSPVMQICMRLSFPCCYRFCSESQCASSCAMWELQCNRRSHCELHCIPAPCVFLLSQCTFAKIRRRRSIIAQRRMDAYGRSIMDELHAIFAEFGPRAQELGYIIHPTFIQNPSVYVPVTYLSPAVPHLVIYASVCKAWNDSVARVLTDKHMLDFRRLLVCSHQRHFVSHWIHRSSEDRFRVNAQLVPEIRLLVPKRPLQ